ncbi:MAG TPA: hypothetical protein VD838_20475 [Anaeromyxobacteraceae bacterium]|nr:hypothetical protein [Anaeromyxobacteraceae bacterium]
MTPTTSRGLNFHVRGQLSTIRDLAMVAMCIALVAAFLAQIWSAPTPTNLSSLVDVGSLVQRGA